MSESKSKIVEWLTKSLWDAYDRRKDSPVPGMRRYALAQKTEALIIQDRVLSNRSVHATH